MFNNVSDHGENYKYIGSRRTRDESAFNSVQSHFLPSSNLNQEVTLSNRHGCFHSP